MRGGESVPQDHSSTLRFSVEESVWFQKGQEVHELLSISLEPDISIREHDQYVSIKGALQLEGEYKMDDEGKEDIDEDPYQFSGARFLQHVETREDGVSELVHHFPVDITIPRNRVTNLEDVYVTVESFDYDFLEERCLKLMADITILGIREEEEVYGEEVDETEEDREIETAAEENEVEIEEEIDNETETEQEEQLEPLYRSEQAEHMESEIEPSHVLSDIFLQKEEEDEEYSSYTIEAKQKQEDNDIASDNNKAADRYEEQPEIEVQMAAHEKSSGESSVEQKHERKNDNALYLTKLFTREDEEEFSKLKMCIVQRGETVEEICHRYDITIQQLIRINNLEADPTVYDGQILYIPVYVNH